MDGVVRPLIDLRTPGTQKLVGRLDPETLQLHVRYRGEECVFDVLQMAQAARGRGEDGPILVRFVDHDSEGVAGEIDR